MRFCAEFYTGKKVRKLYVRKGRGKGGKPRKGEKGRGGIPLPYTIHSDSGLLAPSIPVGNK